MKVGLHIVWLSLDVGGSRLALTRGWHRVRFLPGTPTAGFYADYQTAQPRPTLAVEWQPADIVGAAVLRPNHLESQEAMKAALETNAIINLCSNHASTDRVVRHFAGNPNDSLVLVAHAMDEVTHLDNQKRANLQRLETVSVRDEQRYYTLGASRLNGPDGLRGHTAARDGIQRETRDVGRAYERYRRQQAEQGLPINRAEKWLKRNNNQTDALIYERAVELGCDIIVTDDPDIKDHVPATNSCQPIGLTNFVAGLNP